MDVHLNQNCTALQDMSVRLGKPIAGKKPQFILTYSRMVYAAGNRVKLCTKHTLFVFRALDVLVGIVDSILFQSCLFCFCSLSCVS